MSTTKVFRCLIAASFVIYTVSLPYPKAQDPIFEYIFRFFFLVSNLRGDRAYKNKEVSFRVAH